MPPPVKITPTAHQVSHFFTSEGDTTEIKCTQTHEPDMQSMTLPQPPPT